MHNEFDGCKREIGDIEIEESFNNYLEGQER